MKNILNINEGWLFTKPESEPCNVNLPHTWNGRDGQDGDDEYLRCVCDYEKTFEKPEMEEGDVCYLRFKGVNSEAEVIVNGTTVCKHEGGYSSFVADITDVLQAENKLVVKVCNIYTEKVYPQTADFTFYGGIYRDVELIVCPKNHFTFGEYCAPSLKVTPSVDGENGKLNVTAFVKAEGEYSVNIALYDGENKVAEGKEGEDIIVNNVHLWNGVADPFMYRVEATLVVDGEVVDTACANAGFRSFDVDPEKGFILNGKPYNLHGVCRHQDRPDIGNAITVAEHDEDMRLIVEIGANTIRLAHYQHDNYFYDLCDKYGMVVWAEIPYISWHMTEANANNISQMNELIRQNYNHPSICFWGVSNEITMKKTDTKHMLAHHVELNDLCHKLDPTRKTTLACFAMCGPFNKVAHITDVVSWNLYLGWYMPGLFLNDLWVKFFRLFYPKRCLGYSEYGAEGMPNLHAAKPKRFDNTEEYQCIYHEYMLEFFKRTPYMWATHLWNMFDFAADGRDQGGDPGKNHKGLVTFDRKLRKDSFYLYKSYWSEEPVLHLCGKRFVNRTGAKTDITVYSNVGDVEIWNNGELVATPKAKKGGRVYKCKIDLNATNEIVVKAGEYSDKATIVKVDKPDPAYVVTSGNSASWEKKKKK